MSIITLNTRSLPDSAVTTAKINADAVTDAKIADDVIGTEHLTAGEVDATALGADSVTAAKINDDIISGLTALTSAPADTDELLISDAGTLKRIDVSLVGGKNTPSFLAYKSSDQTSISSNTATKITYTTEIYDTDSTFASSRFTPGVVGKYYVFAFIYLASTVDQNNPEILFYKNGAAVSTEFQVPGATKNIPFSSSTIVELDADDYIEVYAKTATSSATAYSSGTQMRFGGFKLIT